MLVDPTELDPVYSPYFAAQKALAGDDAAGAREALGRLGEAIASLHPTAMSRDARERWNEIVSELSRAATAGKSAEQLPGVRSAFRDLSRAMTKLDTVFGHSGHDVHYEVF